MVKANQHQTPLGEMLVWLGGSALELADVTKTEPQEQPFLGAKEFKLCWMV